MAKKRATRGSKTTSLAREPMAPAAGMNARAPGTNGPLHPGVNGSPGAPTGVVTPTTSRQGVLSDRTPSPSPYNQLAGPPPPDVIQNIDPANWYSPFQPIAPFGSPYVNYPRTFDYRTGINLDYAPARFQLFEQLQIMSRSWGLLRTIIETRKDQLLRMPRAFQVKGKPKATNKYIDRLNEFFRRPDGKTRYGQWTRKLLEDLLVIDAPTIYKWKAVDGTPLALEVLNGATIKPLIDDAGRRPDAPDPAYQQIIKGLPMTNFDENELLYAPMRPTPQLPIYGYSPVEQVFVETMVGIKRLIYQSNFWSEGSMPELIVTVPDSWTPQQTAMFQAHFDALMSGNLDLKSKVRFMPGGMKPFDIKNANGDGLYGEIDTFWARLICFAFSISPTPFVQSMNRATAETAQETAEEEGLHPLMTWHKEEVMDPIIQEDFGFDDIEFNYLPEPEIDQLKQMTTITGYVKEGIWTRDEGRDATGKDVLGDGADELTVDTPNGPVPLKEIVEANRQAALNKPQELQNDQEKHDVSIQGQTQDQKQSGVNHKLDVTDRQNAPPPKKKKLRKSGEVDDVTSPFDVEQLPTGKLAQLRTKVEAVVSGIFENMAPAVGRRVRAGVEAELGGLLTPTADQIDAIADNVATDVSLSEMNDLVAPVTEALAAAGTSATTYATAQVKVAVGEAYGAIFDQAHQEAIDYARERAAEMIGMTWDGDDLVPNPDAEMAITDTTRSKIKDLVIQKLSPGEKPFNLQWAIEDLADEVSGSPLFSRTRAALIAQAEVGMAAGNGQLASLEALARRGMDVSKKWSTSHDTRVCLEHCMVNELAGPIPLHALFPSGDLAPLAHPRCRCALVGVFGHKENE